MQPVQSAPADERGLVKLPGFRCHSAPQNASPPSMRRQEIVLQKQSPRRLLHGGEQWLTMFCIRYARQASLAPYSLMVYSPSSQRFWVSVVVSSSSPWNSNFISYLQTSRPSLMVISIDLPGLRT